MIAPRKIAVWPIGGRTVFRALSAVRPGYRSQSSYGSTQPVKEAEGKSGRLTGSSKLFADAVVEDEGCAISGDSRDHLRLTQGPVWTGEEPTSDAVLRMLVDAHKPLRNQGGIKHNASEEKIKGWMKGFNIEPRVGVAPPQAQENDSIEDIPHRTKIPPHLHRPWYSTYTGGTQAAEEPRVKYGIFNNRRQDGTSLTNLLELQLSHNADNNVCAQLKAVRKSNKIMGRLDNAREGALDYKLGLPPNTPHLVSSGEDEVTKEQTFRGNKQMKGSSVLGAQRGGSSGMRAWAGLVEDRIVRAKEAGFFNNTAGKGKPILNDQEARNPHIERGELYMNRIVKRQGALPPWIELLNLLDSNLATFRSTLLSTYKIHLVRKIISTTSLQPLPPIHMIPDRDAEWEAREIKFHQENVKQINDLIRRMNAQAPSPARRHLVTLEGELNRIRGNVIKEEVWKEIKTRAEQNVNHSLQKQYTRITPSLFRGGTWDKLKNTTRRSFSAIVNLDINPTKNLNGQNLTGSSKNASDEDSWENSHEQTSDAQDPKPLRLVVMIGVGFIAVIYLYRWPVRNDSHNLPASPSPGTFTTTVNTAIAKPTSEPPPTIIHIIRTYVYEPIATLVRFFQLAFLFGPVILLSPMIFVGKTEKLRRSGRSISGEQENWGAVWWYGFLVKQMERAGPSFIKLGQWAASRADLFPAALCAKMGRLHSNGKPHSMSYTHHILESAFGVKLLDIFEDFDDEPIGCGAIAQVYKAKLRPGIFASAEAEDHDSNNLVTPQTASVAVKVIHPYVRATIRRDIAIMSVFAKFINALPGMQWISLPEEVIVFGEMMNSQLDLRVEAHNLDKFQQNFNNRGRRITFPTPIRLCDENRRQSETMKEILIEEFEDALPLKYFLSNGGGPYDHKIASIGLDAFLEMLLLDNWTHGDLHPGNIMIRFYKPTTTDYLFPLLNKSTKNSIIPASSNRQASSSIVPEDIVHSLANCAQNQEAWQSRLEELHAEGFEPQLIFIDAGLVTSLDQHNRRNFLDLFQAVAEFDGYKAGKLMIERCRTPDYAIDEETFALKMQHIILNVKSKTFSLAKIKISDLLTDVLRAVRQHHVKMEGDFVNTVISILLLEGIGRQLDPDMDLFKSALPILRQLGKQMGTMEAIQATPTGNILAMIKLWVWVEARQVAGEVSTLDQWIKYDRLTPSI
ncbi:uncharacterized protein L203_103681 [Cryptococcus depauperatus CBS 7841]|uniref:Uncharacterized protein n=1 Tax=Cryptococcus depauperatus CBS 7841 TaxID=1295531 RepID=A0A1E3IF46_9TREE|nr:Atypical/ABC1/ABC1-C protein kinase [Cryptococcus depauperatus CBS 7841]